MATLLTKLPENFVCCMLSKWLNTKSISRLDIAYCSHAERGTFLSLLSGYVTSESCLYSIGSKYFAKLHWMNSRQLRGTYLKFVQAPELTTEHVATMRTFISNCASHIKTVEMWRKSSDLKLVLQMIARAGCSVTSLTVAAADGLDTLPQWDAPLSTILTLSADVLSELTIDSSESWTLFLGQGVELAALQSVSLTIHNNNQLCSLCAVARNLQHRHLIEPRCSGHGIAAIGQQCTHLEMFIVDGDSNQPVEDIDIGVV